MALTTKRIIALPAQTDPQEGDYLAIDNATSGTHKIPAGRIGVEVDDTLTEAGKAADAKAVGDALDEIRSQIEVTGTASGAIATFSDGADMPAKSVIVNIEPQQSGTGTPSPDNVRQISGWESVSVNVAGKNLLNMVDVLPNGHYNGDVFECSSVSNPTVVLFDTPQNVIFSYEKGTFTGTNPRLEFWNGSTYLGNKGLTSATYTTQTFQNVTAIKFNYGSGGTLTLTKPQIELGSTATAFEPYQGTTTTVNLGRTVYGGTLDVVSGVLTSYPYYPSYNGETLNGRWVCDRAVYAEGTTPPTGSQVALISGTGTTYQLTPTEVNTLLGENNVWADAGDVSVAYVRDLNIAINNLLSGIGTGSLGLMMSAPTEATAEEPTDEQTEEPAEDDMR